MNCNGEDILDFDFDPDLLINLLGKLTLDNIPNSNDVSETLQSLEQRPEASTLRDVTDHQDTATHSSIDTFECGLVAINQFEKSVRTDVPTTPKLEEENKNSFLSSIGLVADSRSCKVKNTLDLPHDSFLAETTSLWNKLASDSKNNGKELSTLKECSTKSGKKTSKRKATVPNAQLNNTCNSTEFHKQTLPFFSGDNLPHRSTNSLHDSTDFHKQTLPFFSGDNLPHRSTNSLHDVFAQRGLVHNIQLSDIGSSSNLNFLFDEITADKSTNFFQVDESNVKRNDNLLQLDQSNNSTEKPVSSPDSGYDTSPCPSAISPYSSPIHTNLDANSLDFLVQVSDDELKSILASIVELENSLTDLKSPPGSVNVPVLKAATNPEDHKVDILNFLKEPLSDYLLPHASPMKDGKIANSSELVVEKGLQSIPVLSSKVSKKSSPKTKDHKLGYEFKYAAKNDLLHSAIFIKGKHFSERNKILKQIQDDVRAQKQVKVIQLISKKLKRTAADDRENKKRRIEYSSSC